MDEISTRPIKADQDIHDRIWTAIAEHRLVPGTRLKEEELAEIFAVSRAKVRQALQNLAHDGLVTLIPNRGAVVSKPTIEEARDVFFARRTIEERLVERLCAIVDDGGVARLRAHVAAERQAHADGDMAAVIRLSGAFHMLIAELAASPILADLLRDLISRTSLITAVYQTREVISCGPDEHGAIADAIAAKQAEQALAVMRHHLAHIEDQLELEDRAAPMHELRSILTP
jgi:DNA-binding GntR family transcriptional regulator